MTNKKVGIIILAIPVVLGGIAYLIRKILTITATTSVSGVGVSSYSANTTVGLMISSLLGLIAVVSILPALIAGIIYLTKKEDGVMSSSVSSRASSGKSDFSVDKWSWGAFFGGPIWALGNKLYIPGIIFLLLWWIPLINLIGHFYLGIKGRQLSWEKGWSSVDEFNKRQKLMASLIGALYVAGLAFYTVRFTKLLRSTISSINTNSESQNVISTLTSKDLEGTYTNADTVFTLIYTSPDTDYEINHSNKYKRQTQEGTEQGEWSFIPNPGVISMAKDGSKSGSVEYKVEKDGDKIILKSNFNLSNEKRWLTKVDKEPTVIPSVVKNSPSKNPIVTNTGDDGGYVFESSEFNYDNLTGTYRNKNQTLILSRDSKFEIELPDDTKSGDWSFTAGSEVLNITSMGVASSNYFEQNYKPEKVGDTIYLKPVESINDKSLWLAKIK